MTQLSSKRRAGVLLHLTSLPSNDFIGNIGQAAHDFARWLKSAGMHYWQVLPLGHTGYGDSPYQCFSAFAGNPLLIDLTIFVEVGLLKSEELLNNMDGAKMRSVDYGAAITYKYPLLKLAYQRFVAQSNNTELKTEFLQFVEAEDNVFWLKDYALFMALKDENAGQCWLNWGKESRLRSKTAINQATKRLADQIGYYEFLQFVFFKQWNALLETCKECDIKIIGDVPIYVALDSADTWANQSQFLLNSDGTPTLVAGVPPDYFSATGQLWGNPIYNWTDMAKDEFSWWTKRIESALKMFDLIRLDHFRGFFGYWAVPSTAETAKDGYWVKGPGKNFFKVLAKHFPSPLPIIAEDLGEITEDVIRGREQLGYPGMKVLQFAWSPESIDPLIPNPNSNYLPYQIEENSIVYTGTHDNNTTRGWWEAASKEEHQCLQIFLSVDGNCIHHDLMRCAYSSAAHTAIVPMQDILGLNQDARMNFPGMASGNWSWRVQANQLTAELANWLFNFSLLYGRCNNPPKKAIKAPCKKPTY